MPDEVIGNTMPAEEVAPDSWLAQQVYAKFGLAMYAGQALEYVIATLLEWSGFTSGQYLSHEEWERADINFLRKTLGALRKELLAQPIDLAHLEGDLTRAVELRNFLAHHYFRERIDALTTQEGCKNMLAELEQAVNLLNGVVQKLRSITRNMVNEFGGPDIIPVATENKSQGFGEPLPGLS
jgi:hypothetical protein